MKALKLMVMKLFCIVRGIEMEKEKVIKALETCIGCQPCKNCPYEKGYLAFPSCAVDMFKDALTVIKELEAKCGNSDS